MMSEQVNASWHGGFAGVGRLSCSGVEMPLSLSASYGGTNLGVNPDQLLASAIVSCFLITYGIVLEKNGIPYRDLRGNGRLRKTETLPPTVIGVCLDIQVHTTADHERMQAMAQRAKEICTISRALDKTIAIDLMLTYLPMEVLRPVDQFQPQEVL